MLYKTAFTLIELLVGVSIISILTLITLPVFSNVGTNTTLTQNAENMLSDIRGIQSKALSGAVSGIYPDTNGYWGVEFDCPDSYTLGQPDINNPLNTPVVGQQRVFTYGVKCSTLLSRVVFERLSGRPVVGAGGGITVSDDNGHTRVINIGSGGVIW